MASKVYSVFSCVLLCTAICILDGCRRQWESACYIRGTRVTYGSFYRYISFGMCAAVVCDREEGWKRMETECAFDKTCYEDGAELVFDGRNHRCDINDHRAYWTII
ncbi:hypothetical protein PoB_000391600 [Plakobranchus ocellatus]|uniref:Uncharacterized protein n=1 Tax=Plakobranchus ocellatus TaxID=259542 RepID=A0AAV3Y4S3_9GAST|nr:hypothetical protein PoB_000391600 [Plakobranchus ocellatus]